MKVYDGAAMVADKADAWIVPVRIEGAQRSTLSYMKPWQIKKALVSQDHHHLPAQGQADARPRAARHAPAAVAAGAALQDMMIEAMVLNSAMDQTLFAGPRRRVAQPRRRPADPRRPHQPASSPTPSWCSARRCWRASWSRWAKTGENVGVLLPNANGVVVTFFALQSLGRVPAMLNFTAGPQACSSALQGG